MSNAPPMRSCIFCTSSWRTSKRLVSGSWRRNTATKNSDNPPITYSARQCPGRIVTAAKNSDATPAPKKSSAASGPRRPSAHIGGDFFHHDHAAEHFFGVAEDAGEHLQPDKLRIGLRKGGRKRERRLSENRDEQKAAAADNIGTERQAHREDRSETEEGDGEADFIFGNMQRRLNLGDSEPVHVLVEAREQRRDTDQREMSFPAGASCPAADAIRAAAI